jgi:hypothetical protein
METPEFQYQVEMHKLADSISKNALGVDYYVTKIQDDEKALMFARKVIDLARELERVIDGIDQKVHS